ncbi:MAG: hypothetical protein GBAus27B_000061 [Mycoplasmataceae bacterium]|nr:MAG: hypothetical protein GBAus27B_000061 [Mycoplasmataceae bacterium]
MNIPKFIHQNERMANLSPEKKKKLEELEKSGYQIEEYSYPSEPEILPNWSNIQTTITNLIIAPNTYKFPDDNLTLVDYPNLQTVYASGLGLKEAWFTNLPQLNNLYLRQQPVEGGW